jgi:hypothetical protein
MWKERRTDRHREAIKMHDDLLLMSLLGSDPGISHLVHSLIRGEDKFSTVVGQLLSKFEVMGADTWDDNIKCTNNCAKSASNSLCKS